MANKTIKDAAKATAEQVGEVLNPVEETKKEDAAKSTPGQDGGVVSPVEEIIEKSIIKQKIYVGPNILGLPTYTVIETDFTEHIKGFIEKCPEIKKLFVPIAEMANTEKRTKEKGTLEHRHYQKVMAFKNSSRKGEQ